MEGKTIVIHKTQREVALQKTHNTKHMQGWVGWWWGVEPHKKTQGL